MNGLGWVGERRSNSLMGKLFLLLIPVVWVVVCECEAMRKNRGTRQDFQDFQIQDGQLGSGKKYSVLRGTIPSCPSSPIRDRPATKQKLVDSLPEPCV